MVFVAPPTQARKSMDVGTDYTAAASAGFGADWKELCEACPNFQ
jgi:hypothetical protein